MPDSQSADHISPCWAKWLFVERAPAVEIVICFRLVSMNSSGNTRCAAKRSGLLDRRKICRTSSSDRPTSGSVSGGAAVGASDVGTVATALAEEHIDVSCLLMAATSPLSSVV